MTALRVLLLLSLQQTYEALDVFTPSRQRALVTSDTTLICSFSVDIQPLNLNFLAISWSFQEKVLLRYDNKRFSTQDPRMSLSMESLEDGYASLHISKVAISDGGIYKCMVIYSPEREEKEVVFEVFARPLLTIFTTKIQRNTENALTCKVTGFFPPDIGINWYRNVEVLRNQLMGKPHIYKDGTYEINSTVTIIPSNDDQNQTFSCRIQHDSLEEPLQEDFQLIYGDIETSSSVVTVVCIILILVTIIVVWIGIFLWNRKYRKADKGTFTVMDIEGPTKLIAGEETSLHCTATKCPENTSVTWLEKRGGQVCEIQKYIGGDTEEEETLMDAQYGVISCREGPNYTSSLKFRASVTKHKDVTFICRYSCGKEEEEKTFHCRAIYAKPQMSVSRSLIVSGVLKYSVTLEKFYPRDITIKWTHGVGKPQHVLKSKETLKDTPDGMYSVCSEVTIPEEILKDPEFRVRVSWKHGSLDSPGHKDLSIRDQEYIWTPAVEEIETSNVFLHNTLVTLQCHVLEYFPDAVTVTWLRRSENQELCEEIDNVASRAIIPRREADNTYSCTDSLTIIPTLSVHQGAEYICRVDHPSLEKPIEKKTKKLVVKAIPQMVEPIVITMKDSARVYFTLSLQNFYPKDIEIEWKHEDKYSQLPSHNTPLTTNKDLTYDITSVAHKSTKSFTDPKFKVFVTWKHQSLGKPETRTLTIRDLPWLPEVGEITIPELKENKKISLTCNISEYFPDHLSVSWFRKGPGTDSHQTPLPNGDYKVPSKLEQKGKSCQSSLTFNYLSKRDQGSEFICKVEHPNLEHAIERSTGPLGLGLSMNGTGKP